MNIEHWFVEPGAYVLVDGQFGSTGKGLFAAYIAENAPIHPNWVTTNAGPNSGHTAFWRGKPIVTRQLPIASIILQKMGTNVRTLINAGAIIDAGVLLAEINEFIPGSKIPFIHPIAAVIQPGNIEADRATRYAIASTGKGIGPALQNKIGRVDFQIARDIYFPMLPHGEKRTWDNFWDWNTDAVFVETAQGFSLGLNSVFYPHVTSRECTVMQAIADARIPAQKVKQVAMTVRTYPIRVGNTENSSGEWYDDQTEIEWGDLGIEPELTTVTKRPRRLASWSRSQFRASVAANRPDVIFANFMNYLTREQAAIFVDNLFKDYIAAMGGRKLPKVYYGFGPQNEDVVDVWWKGEGRFLGEAR